MKTEKRFSWGVGFVAGALAVFASCGNDMPAVEGGPSDTHAVIYTEPCDKYAKETDQNPGQAILYAEHEFPGLTAADVASRVVVLGESWVTFPGYTQMLRTQYFDGLPKQMMLVRDGAAAVICGFANDPLNVQSVTFVFR